MEEEGRSGKLSDQSEALLHCSVTNSNSESLVKIVLDCLILREFKEQNVATPP